MRVSALARRRGQRQQRLDAVGHRHERNARVGPHEAGVRLALAPRRESSPARSRTCRPTARSPPRSGPGSARSGSRRGPTAARPRAACSAARSSGPSCSQYSLLQPYIVVGVLQSSSLHAAGARAWSRGRAGRRRQSTRDRRTTTGRPCDSRFALRELEQVERALDVDLVRGDRRELGARREQRRQVEDGVDLELGQDALEQRACR